MCASSRGASSRAHFSHANFNSRAIVTFHSVALTPGESILKGGLARTNPLDAYWQLHHHAGPPTRDLRDGGEPRIVAEDPAALPLYPISRARAGSQPRCHGGGPRGDSYLLDLRTNHRSRESRSSFQPPE